MRLSHRYNLQMSILDTGLFGSCGSWFCMRKTVKICHIISTRPSCEHLLIYPLLVMRTTTPYTTSVNPIQTIKSLFFFFLSFLAKRNEREFGDSLKNITGLVRKKITPNYISVDQARPQSLKGNILSYYKHIASPNLK